MSKRRSQVVKLALVGGLLMGAGCSSDESSPTSTRALDAEVAENEEVVLEAVRPFLGQTLEDFTMNATELGYTVVQSSGFNYKPDRVRVLVDDGFVVDVWVG